MVNSCSLRRLTPSAHWSQTERWLGLWSVWVGYASFERLGLILISFKVGGGCFHSSNQSEYLTHGSLHLLNEAFISESADEHLNQVRFICLPIIGILYE